jgi:hypothetical protein
MELTEHFRTERADRYAFIATTIGVGEVVHSFKQPKNKWGTEPCTVNITSTGVAVVTNPKNAIVTMYILGMNEAQKYFENGVVPFVLAAIIRMNMKKRLHLMQNEKKF